MPAVAVAAAPAAVVKAVVAEVLLIVLPETHRVKFSTMVKKVNLVTMKVMTDTI